MTLKNTNSYQLSFLSIFLLIITNFSFANETQVIIPFEPVQRLILVKAQIDDQLGWFVLDSGSPELLVNKAKFKNQGQEHRKVNLTGLTNHAEGTTVYYAKQFQLSTIIKKHIAIKRLEMTHLENVLGRNILGIIGQNVFRKYELLIDFSRRELRFTPINRRGDRAVPHEKKPDHVLNFNLQQHFPVIHANVNGVHLNLVFDSGASTILIDHKWKALLHETIQIRSTASLLGALSRSEGAILAKLKKLQILPDQDYTNLRVTFADMASFKKCTNLKVNGFIGFDFYVRQPIAINFKKKQIYVWERAQNPGHMIKPLISKVDSTSLKLRDY